MEVPPRASTNPSGWAHGAPLAWPLVALAARGRGGGKATGKRRQGKAPKVEVATTQGAQQGMVWDGHSMGHPESTMPWGCHALETSQCNAVGPKGRHSTA
eukprot:Skav234705  [mRNA]  locus=scaffold3643:246447:247952:- [translate_table: standard]